MKKTFLILGLLLAMEGSAMPADSVKHRSPFLAGTFSYLCPGAGQFYNKEKEKGWEYLGVTAGSLVAAGMVLNWAENTPDDGDWAMGLLAGGYLIGIGATTWVAGIVDAGRSAWKINHEGPLVYPEGYQRKSPVIAGTLSALLPGGGQFYLGKTEQGVRHLMIFAASAYGMIASLMMTDQSYLGGYMAFTVWECLWLGNTIWSVVDGVKTANARNLAAARPKEDVRVQLAPALELNKAPLALGANASPTFSAGLRLAVTF